MRKRREEGFFRAETAAGAAVRHRYGEGPFHGADSPGTLGDLSAGSQEEDACQKRETAARLEGHAEKRGGLYITRVQNPVSYAPYVEYGHRTRGAGGVPEAQRKRKWIEGQFMMTNSVRATEAERKAFAAKRFEEFLKGGGKRGG